LRSDLHTLQPALIVAARSLSRELATCQPFGQFTTASERRAGIGSTGLAGDGYGSGRSYAPASAGQRVAYLNGTGGSSLRAMSRRSDSR
jgi:hypothetical protein